MASARLTATSLNKMLQSDLVIRGEIITQIPPLPRLRIYALGREAIYAGSIIYAIRENNYQTTAHSIRLGLRLSVNPKQRTLQLNELIQLWTREAEAFAAAKPIVILGNPGYDPKTVLRPTDPQVVIQLSRLSGVLACKLSNDSWPPGPDQKMWRSVLGHMYLHLDRLILRLAKMG